MHCGAEWYDVYDASAGVDLDGPTQRHNPFNGDAVAPDAWFALAQTKNVMCAARAADDVVRLYVDEHQPLHAGVLLADIARRTPRATLTQHVVADRKGDVKTRTAVEFPRARRQCTTPRCCEMHALVWYAEETRSEKLQPLTQYRASTSGHMKVEDLLRVDPYGAWEEFCYQWASNSNDIVTRVTRFLR